MKVTIEKWIHLPGNKHYQPGVYEVPDDVAPMLIELGAIAATPAADSPPAKRGRPRKPKVETPED